MIYLNIKGFLSTTKPWNFMDFLSVISLLRLDLGSWITIRKSVTVS